MIPPPCNNNSFLRPRSTSNGGSSSKESPTPRINDAKVLGIEIIVSKKEVQQKRRRHFLPQLADRMDPNLMLDAMTRLSHGLVSSFGTSSENDSMDEEQPARGSRRQERRKESDSTTAERARNRLKKHGLSGFGDLPHFDQEEENDALEVPSITPQERKGEFCFYPKTASFLIVRELVGGAYARAAVFTAQNSTSPSQLMQWLTEPLNLTPEDIDYVYRCTVAYPMFEMFQCRGVLIGLRGCELVVEEDCKRQQTTSTDLSAIIESKAMRRLSQHTPSKASKNSKAESTIVGSLPSSPLQACMLFREYNPTKEGTKGILRSMVGLMSHTCAYLEKKEDNSGILLPFDRKQMAMLGNFMTRANELEILSASWHAKYGPPGVHWYLSDVAVSVSGQGHGTRLMTTLTQMADRYDMDIYLECGPGENVDFFSKFDFQVVWVEELLFANSATTTTSPPSLQLHLMVRQSKGCTRTRIP